MMRRSSLCRWLCVLVMVQAIPWTRGEVRETGPGGFVVGTVLEVTREPAMVYKTLVEDVGKWWEDSHTFFQDASALSIEPRVGGCFCEEAGEGRSARHLEVVFVDPGTAIRLRGALGPLQEHAVDGSLTITVQEIPSGSRVELTYRIGGYLPGGFESWAAPVDRVLATQLKRLKNYVETGSPE